MSDEPSSVFMASAEILLPELQGQAQRYMRQARADHTRRAYQSDWRRFAGWCEKRGVQACPASVDSVVLFLTEEAQTHKVSTLRRRLSSLTQAHRAAGWESPTEAPQVRLLMAGIRREKGSASHGRKAILVPDLEAMLRALPAGLLGLRDRALLLTGFAGAFRRSELVALDWRDLEFREAGVVVTVRRSKTDQEGQGRSVAIPKSLKADRCPVRALLDWRAGCFADESTADGGPVFRPFGTHLKLLPARLSDKAVARVIKRSLEACGRDPSEYSGHSLRAGFATAAAQGGAPEHLIMSQTGHRSAASLRRYIREANLFLQNAGDYTGL